MSKRSGGGGGGGGANDADVTGATLGAAALITSIIVAGMALIHYYGEPEPEPVRQTVKPAPVGAVGGARAMESFADATVAAHALECKICMNGVCEYSLGCGHCFCGGCLTRVGDRGSCPVCRRPIAGSARRIYL